MRVKVDLNKCEGHGRCYSYSPDVFDEGEDRKTKLLVENIPDDDFDLQSEARTAANMCPVGAIDIEE